MTKKTNWKKIHKCSHGKKGGYIDYILLNPFSYNLRIPARYKPKVDNFNFNLHYQGDNEDVFAIEFTDQGDRPYHKSGFSGRGLCSHLNIKEKTRFGIEVDKNGWLICTRIKEPTDDKGPGNN